MSDYTIENGQYLKVTDKDTGDLIGIFEVSDGNVLSTIHTVETVSEEEYLIYVASKEAELD
ncbi:hypothetical protein OK024_01490 [Acinetobacter sp. UGAL515B_02]|nr:hypothetical protein [Acinetobacter sp. UGAL515B_02]WON80544.1 hypothetical protein OK024_01490 [Acinetobacter sp. UGAL515B_02]